MEKHIQRFPGKARHAIVTIVAVFLATAAYSQSTTTRAQLQPINATGYSWQTGAFKRLYLPQDTLPSADSGAVAIVNKILYVKNVQQASNYYWGPISAGGSPGADNSIMTGSRIATGDYTQNMNFKTLFFDTLSNMRFFGYGPDMDLPNNLHTFRFERNNQALLEPFHMSWALRDHNDFYDSIGSTYEHSRYSTIIKQYGDGGNQAAYVYIGGNSFFPVTEIAASNGTNTSYIDVRAGTGILLSTTDSIMATLLPAADADSIIGVRNLQFGRNTLVKIPKTSLALNNQSNGYRWLKSPGGQYRTLKLNYGLIADTISDGGAIILGLDTISANHVVTQSDLNDTAKVLRAASGTALVDVDVFLFAGQSNMVGQGDSALSPLPIPGKVLQINTGVISDAKDPVGIAIGSSANKSHYGSIIPSFGNTYYNRTSRRFCAVPSSVSGTSQTVAGDVGNGNWDTTGVLFDSAVARVNSAMSVLAAKGYNPIFKGVIWLQGESDAIALEAATITVADYTAAFRKMIKKFRIIYGSTMPFNIIRIGTSNTHPDSYWKSIRDAQQAVANSDSVTQIVYYNAVNFFTRSLMVDNIHFNQVGLNEVGRLTAMAVTSHMKNMWQTQEANTYYSNGNVGIGGNNTSGYALDILSRNPSGNEGVRIVNGNGGANATSAIRFDTDAGQGALIFLTSIAGGTNIGGSKAFTVASLQTGGLKLVSNAGGDITFSKSTQTTQPTWMRIVAPTGDFLYNTDADSAARGKFQVHSTSVFDSLMRLNNVPAPLSTYNIMTHSTGSDSAVGQISAESLRGYKRYVALISQSGTSDPTATILGSNEIGSIVWTRAGAGIYTGTLSGAFTANKTWLVVSTTDQTGTPTTVRLTRSSANTVLLTTWDGAALPTDLYTNISVEIRVYP
jgi:hypothetical protein